MQFNQITLWMHISIRNHSIQTDALSSHPTILGTVEKANLFIITKLLLRMKIGFSPLIGHVEHWRLNIWYDSPAPKDQAAVWIAQYRELLLSTHYISSQKVRSLNFRYHFFNAVQVHFPEYCEFIMCMSVKEMTTIYRSMIWCTVWRVAFSNSFELAPIDKENI